MDFGEAIFATLSENKVLIVRSIKSPGLVYTFNQRRENEFRCETCYRQFRKGRTVTVKNGRIIGRKHPEDGHHDDCRPVPENDVEKSFNDRLVHLIKYMWAYTAFYKQLKDRLAHSTKCAYCYCYNN